MNYRFRKKPVVIEAFQMTEERRWGNADWPHWLHEAWNRGENEVGAFRPSDGPDQPEIVTLEGVMTVEWGDWIIRGVQGELYPCKPDIFEQTYEEER